MLGFDVSERTISRWMKRASKAPEPARSWLNFLHNHREAIAAMDFFTVPTIPFGVLYCFFIIGHDRRRILHFNVTRHPTGAWIVQPLREAFPSGGRYGASFTTRRFHKCFLRPRNSLPLERSSLRLSTNSSLLCSLGWNRRLPSP